MPRATRSAAEICEKTLAELENEADAALDRFISAAESGKGFSRAIEKIEGQLADAKRLQGAERDLELNEAAVIAEKLEGELEHAGKLAAGSALLESEEEWAEQFESVKDSIELMHLHMRKMVHRGRASMHSGGALEARSALNSFRKESGKCKAVLARLKSTLADRSHPSFSKVEAAKKGLRSVRAGVGKAFSKMTKSRLRKQIAESKRQIMEFFSGASSAKMFVDHKHLTLQRGAHKVHVPLTQAVKYALEEIAPMENALSKLGRKGTVVTATFERGRDGSVLHVGERSVAGDAIIYKERSYTVNFGS